MTLLKDWKLDLLFFMKVRKCCWSTGEKGASRGV